MTASRETSSNADTRHRRLQTILEGFANLQRSSNTTRAYHGDVRQFLKHLGLLDSGLKELAQLNPTELHTRVKAYLDSLTRLDAFTGEVLNGNTVNRKRNTLIKFFDYLSDLYGFPPANPARKFCSYPKPEQSLTPMLSEAEIRQLMRHLRSLHTKGLQEHRNYLVMLGLFHFALRRRELATLRWDHIHLHPHHLQLKQKGGRKKYLPIPPKMLEALMAFGDHYGRPSPFIFRPIRNNRTGDTEKPLSTNAILQIVTSVTDELFPGRGITPHSFRSSFVSLARSYRLDDKEIMNATGHSSSDMVNYYDIREKLEANAVNFFGDWIE